MPAGVQVLAGGRKNTQASLEILYVMLDQQHLRLRCSLFPSLKFFPLALTILSLRHWLALRPQPRLLRWAPPTEFTTHVMHGRVHGCYMFTRPVCAVRCKNQGAPRNRIFTCFRYNTMLMPLHDLTIILHVSVVHASTAINYCQFTSSPFHLLRCNLSGSCWHHSIL